MKTQTHAQLLAATLDADGASRGASHPGGLPKTPKPRPAKRRASKTLSEAADPVAGTTGSGRVSLEYLNPTAQKVFIAGSFNDWNPCAHALTSVSHGKWAVELALLPGRYEYRLVVDDQWIDDPKAVEHSPNPYGGVNSVLHV